MTVELYLGDCVKLLRDVPSESVDAVITDPPYPYIKRSYGYWTEQEWWAMVVEGVIPQVRRILKPTGSAVFILQPNSEHVGKTRPWLWRFMLWVCEEWNMVQDVWWFNHCAIPTISVSLHELLRQSIKICVWCGIHSCYKNQEAVLMPEADRTHSRNATREKRLGNDSVLRTLSGQSVKISSIGNSSKKRGGVTPFNCLVTGANSINGNNGHSAGTPLKLADWWTRYICPPGGTVCDPFAGTSTMGLAALKNGCNFIGIEKEQEYYETSKRRLDEAQEQMRMPC